MRPIRLSPDILTAEQCIAYLESTLWGGVPTCPNCKSKRSTRLKNENRYHCNGCNSPYSVTAQTFFHHSHVPLHKWFVTVAVVLQDREPVSGRELARVLGVNRNTANEMIRRIDAKLREAKHRVLLEAIATMVLSIPTTPTKEYFDG